MELIKILVVGGFTFMLGFCSALALEFYTPEKIIEEEYEVEDNDFDSVCSSLFKYM